MKASLVLSLVGLACAAPTTCPQRTVWLCGDSTMAPGGGHNHTEGWGQYLQYSLDSRIRVNNSAYAGRSARTFTTEGRFQAIIDKVQPGDWVVIEFGHNDGGVPGTASDSANRADCPGIGSETCPITLDGQPEIIQTFDTYMMNASAKFLSLGAKVIISSPTPDNPWETGTFVWNPTRFEYYSWYVVQQLGGPARGIYYVNHGDYCAQAIKNLGPTVSDANYPMDHTHTSPYFADLFAQAFVLGAKCGTSPFQGFVVNATSRIEGPILGTCLPVNSTLPI